MGSAEGQGRSDRAAEPTAAADGLVVRVRASSVNPVDNAIAAGMPGTSSTTTSRSSWAVTTPAPSKQSARTSKGYAVGDEVFGFLLHAHPTVHEGSWTELIALTPEMQIAPNPDSLDVAAAGVAPLAGIVALAAVDALALSEG